MRIQVAGFNILELVMTLIVVGLMSTIIIPRLNPDEGFRDLFYADDILSAVRYAHKRALASGCGVRVALSVATPPAIELYQQSTCTQGGAWDTQIFTTAEGKPSVTPNNPDNVSVGSTNLPFLL